MRRSVGEAASALRFSSSGQNFHRLSNNSTEKSAGAYGSVRSRSSPLAAEEALAVGAASSAIVVAMAAALIYEHLLLDKDPEIEKA